MQLPGLHVFRSHDEDALGADPVLGGRLLQLDAFQVEHPRAGLAADHLALLVADPAVAVVRRVLKKTKRINGIKIKSATREELTFPRDPGPQLIRQSTLRFLVFK